MREYLRQRSKHESGEHNRTPWLKWALGAVAGGAAITAPLAASHALATTEVRDEIGPVPSTISFSPGFTELDLNFIGDFYSEDLTRFNIGAKITPSGIDVSSETANFAQLKQTVEPLIQNPEASADGYESALLDALKDKFLMIELLGTIGFGGVLLLFKQQMGEAATPKKIAIIASALFTLSGGAAGYELHEWNDNNQITESYSVDGAAESGFGDISASTMTLKTAAEKILPGYEQQKDRIDEANKTFIETAKKSIDEQLENGDFVPPKDGQTTFILMSDLHSNYDMIEVYRYLVQEINKKYGERTVKLAVHAGDETYGSSIEKSAVDKSSKIADENIAVEGNHDSKITEQQEKAAGFDIVNGNVKTKDGVSVTGYADPKLTNLSSLVGAGNDKLRSENDKTKYLLESIADTLAGNDDETQLRSAEIKMGEKLLKLLQKSQPTVALSHEASGLAPSIKGLDKNADNYVSQAEMDAYFSSTVTANDIPASIFAYGHWHRKFQYKIVPKTGGGNGVILELNSAGGASARNSISNFSLPYITPAQTASIVFTTIDDSSKLPVSLQEFTTERSGETAFPTLVSIPQTKENLDAPNSQPAAQKTTSPGN